MYLLECEFGIFFLFILGNLNKYLETDKNKLTIQTYENYAKILQLIFPNNDIDYVIIPNEKERNFFNVVNKKRDKQLYLNDILIDKKEYNNIITSRFNINMFRYCNKITLPSDLESSIQKKYSHILTSDIICLHPRYRKSNIMNNTLWDFRNAIIDEVEQIINENNNELIVIVGIEILDIDYKKYKNVLLVTDIYETIYFLSICKEFITPASGMWFFALYCGCTNIKINHIFVDDMIYINFNPLNLMIDYKIKSIINTQIINNINSSEYKINFVQKDYVSIRECLKDKTRLFITLNDTNTIIENIKIYNNFNIDPLEKY